MGTGQNGGDYFAIDPAACEMFRGGWVDRLYEEADRLFKRAGHALPVRFICPSAGKDL